MNICNTKGADALPNGSRQTEKSVETLFKIHPDCCRLFKSMLLLLGVVELRMHMFIS